MLVSIVIVGGGLFLTLHRLRGNNHERKNKKGILRFGQCHHGYNAFDNLYSNDYAGNCQIRIQFSFGVE